MAKGDHIYIKTGLITHHGIDCGDGSVIHYRGKQKGGIITQTSYKEFAQGKQVYVKCCYDYKFSADAIVKRAKRRLHEPNYHPIFNNCEHFATDCKTGQPDSQQIGNGVIAAALTLGFALIAAETSPLVGIVAFNVLKTFSESDDKKHRSQNCSVSNLSSRRGNSKSKCLKLIQTSSMEAFLL